MQKIQSSLETIIDDIEKFYNYKEWHFLTLNGVALEDDKLEVQWIFSRYDALDDVMVYHIEVPYDALIPSIVHLIPSAIISQRELVDMFGIKVEGSTKGLYLDEDSMQSPLKGCQL
ncbi:MAG: NADH-quinone oxidoreductase subunit C [Sulfurimonadaceae bacterium]|jgi:Ni,Fe-hydrogenase III component G|nr:NADH-quinone oxidoreductase subunit C [Sulfurimonadaceae bacterium]